ncbi:MAG: sulfatase [Chitinophagaceae bacterium]
MKSSPFGNAFYLLLFFCTAFFAGFKEKKIPGGFQLTQGAAETNNGKAPPKYNVLFIAVDDLRPELNCYGSTHIKSPNIDKLAAGGLIFNRAYCQQAVCSPSRTSLLTGMRPDATRIYDLQTHFRNTIPDVVTLPQHFKNNGYYSVGMGKLFHGNLQDERSWSEPWWQPKTKSGLGYMKEENILLDKGAKGRGPAFEEADMPDSAYKDGKIADRAIQTLQRIKDKPFFLGVGFSKPHLPFVAPKKYWDMYDPVKIKLPDTSKPVNVPSIALSNWGELRAYKDIPSKGPLSPEQSRQLRHGYYACVSHMDAQVGKVLDELKRLGLDKNTIVILWGDHGWKLGDYGDWCKHTNFELDANAALILRAPEMKSKGRKTDALVEFVDIYPSLCELAGIPLPTHLQGSSFMPLLNNPSEKGKSVALTQYPRGGGMMGYSMRTDRYRFTSWQKKDDWQQTTALELYDHQKDPGEKINLANQPEYAKLVGELSSQLKKEWQHSLQGKQL